MQRIKWTLALAGLLGLATAANAVTTDYQCSTGANAVNTWCFVPGTNGTVSDGATYSISTGGPNNNTVSGSISVYSEQVNSSNNNFYSFSDSTINGMFAVNDLPNQEGAGIAPYDPQDGTSNSFANQPGIADGISCGYRTTCDNVMLVELGSNIAQGTTLSFLLEAGIGASTDSANFFYSDTTSNVASNGINLSSMTDFGTAGVGSISTFGTTDQVSLVKNTSGVEWVAIEADCHYMLLSSITGAPPTSSVPEPRFYGFLLAGLLGIAGMVYQRRRAAQTIA
jgi:hypothetical protein